VSFLGLQPSAMKNEKNNKDKTSYWTCFSTTNIQTFELSAIDETKHCCCIWLSLLSNDVISK